MWTSRLSPAPGVSAHRQARLGSQRASPAEGTLLAETPRAAGVAPGWAGVLALDRVPDVILTQPFGRRAAHGETGWTRMLF